jgi:hypothetical protein
MRRRRACNASRDILCNIFLLAALVENVRVDGMLVPRSNSCGVVTPQCRVHSAMLGVVVNERRALARALAAMTSPCDEQESLDVDALLRKQAIGVDFLRSGQLGTGPPVCVCFSRVSGGVGIQSGPGDTTYGPKRRIAPRAAKALAATLPMQRMTQRVCPSSRKGVGRLLRATTSLAPEHRKRPSVAVVRVT